MDRKFGIHYIIVIQRPDVKVISGSIKGNMPTRIAFKTVTDTDSEVILDVPGAEKIKNKGRCLLKYLGELQEMQTLYIENDDVTKILKKAKKLKTHDEIEAEERQKKKQAEERNKAQQEELRKKAIEEELARKQAESAKAKADQVKENLINMFHQNNGNPYKKGV
jgi:S-DNA-T family DNA segregation ATPase FtsK/SpoIIIE